MSICTIDGCDRDTIAHGFCTKHYQRWKRHGDPTTARVAPRRRPDLDRIMAFVTVTDTCWLWTGALNVGGYGRTRFRDRDYIAHRAVYELLVGEVPDGLQLDHLCRVRHCVNPAHLEPVTARENTIRGLGPAAENAARTHCIAGHELAGDNLYVEKDGHRGCRECRSRRKRERAA